jgi:aspartyl-tRNA synthetase
MERTYIGDLQAHIEKKVTVMGWVNVRRDQGKMIFLDLRDKTGKVQMVALPNNKEALEVAEKVRPEWVLSITGKVNRRPEKNINKDDANGTIEIEITNIEILNESETPPFDIHEDGKNVDEEARLKYRYIDLRRERMQKNLKVRASFIKKCRDFLDGKNFTEIETPLLTKATPEGSRDFLVPSRLHKGKFYALPQSPQQYKELLMTAGFERYYQIARALRDEDLRADRGFEHTQIDLEISFVKREDVMRLVEEMITKTVEEMGYTIKQKPFPIITYKDAVRKYGADKFDMRSEEEKKSGVLAYAWVVDFPSFEKADNGKWTFSHNPFSAPKDEFLNDLLAGKNIENIISQQYDLVCNGHEVGGGSIRAHKPEVLKATYKVMGYSDKEIEESVGHMLKAFALGTPPHGGLALGVERNIMILTGEEYLREVQAFPMTRGGKTSVVDAPSD